MSSGVISYMPIERGNGGNSYANLWRYHASMTAERLTTLRAHDGFEMPAFVAIPDAGHGPGMVVIQEIFGVTDYIRDVCRRLAGAGYVALAPALYARMDPALELDERREDSLPRALEAGRSLDFQQAVDDAVAALEHVRAMAEVTDRRAGIIGFCLGGGIAYLVAAASDPDVAVCYYGSAIPGALDRAADITSPLLFHFGEADAYITAEQRADVERAFSARENVAFHRHPGAGHAFDNHNAAMFHEPEAARRSWPQTLSFLSRWFPVSR